MPKLTERNVSSYNVDPAKEHIIWDSELKGFALRVSPKGLKSYFVQYRVGSATRRMKIGTHGKIKAEAASVLGANVDVMADQNLNVDQMEDVMKGDRRTLP